MTVLLASDLDRTLIHPTRTLSDADAPTSEVVEIYEGRGITCAATATLEALRELAAADAFVPVTTRSLAQLARITPIWELAASGYAVCANGSTVLHRGKPDPGWAHHLDASLAGSAPLAEARATVEREIGSPDSVDWMPLLRDCDERFLYSTLLLDRIPTDLEAAANAAVRPIGWRAVLHTRKLYVLPEGLRKGDATRYVAGQLGASHVVAAGDSVLDLELLATGDEAWVPAGAELTVLGQVPAGARITDRDHVHSGLEIARAALEHLGATTAPTSAR